MEREFDAIVFGATGFTGRQTAAYLADTEGLDGLRGAIAGRSRRRLEAVRADLGERLADLPIVVADATDAEAVDGMIRRTRVVCTTAGPFDRPNRIPGHRPRPDRSLSDPGASSAPARPRSATDAGRCRRRARPAGP